MRGYEHRAIGDAATGAALVNGTSGSSHEQREAVTAGPSCFPVDSGLLLSSWTKLSLV